MKVKAGDSFRVSGGRIALRVAPGIKTSRLIEKPDLRLDLLTPSGWVAVGMDLSFLLADFHAEVEDRLYPRGLGFQGGAMFEEYLHVAFGFGWEEAVRRLENDKRRKVPA
jgi:hypothetical protein